MIRRTRPDIIAATLVLLLALLAMLVVSFSCSDDKSTDGGGGGGDVTTIGPAGGTVTDADGAKVVIPAGALSTDVRITVDTHTDESTLPCGLGVIEFCGAVDFGPDGQEFALPVTITIPAPEPLVPGSRFPLFYYDDVNDRWVQSASIATVAADGLSYSGQIDHFSDWTGGGVGPGGLFDDFEDDFGDGSNAEGAFDLYKIYFMQNIADIGEKGIRDGQCHEVVGIHFDLTYQVNGSAGSLFDNVGQTTGNVFMVDYQLDRVTVSTDTWFDLFVTVFYKCSPDFTMAADPGQIDVDEQSTVSATLTCDGQPMPGRNVTFEVTAGLGTISPSSATTGGDGKAQTTFTASDEGREAVFGSYVACQGKAGQETLQHSASIDIGSSWSGTMNLTFQHSGDGVAWVWSDALTVNFTLQIEENTITGTGSGSQSQSVYMVDSDVCSVSGQWAPGFTVSVSGTKTGEYFDFQVVPSTLSVGFNVHCESDPPIDYPVIAYANLVASVMGQDIFLHVLASDGATDSGSGSEGFGEDPPVNYTYSLTMHNGD